MVHAVLAYMLARGAAAGRTTVAACVHAGGACAHTHTHLLGALHAQPDVAVEVTHAHKRLRWGEGGRRAVARGGPLQQLLRREPAQPPLPT